MVSLLSTFTDSASDLHKGQLACSPAGLLPRSLALPSALLLTHVELCSCLVPWLQVYKLQPDRLYASYFGGDEETGLKPDEEAKDFWCALTLATS